jgi:hypothetical protein
MCGLCGTLGGTHWADGMAGPAAGPDAVPWLRRQARRRRVDVGNRILSRFGLSMTDWNGTAFVLRSRTGATAITTSLTDLWPQAERLAGRVIDPLDPALVRQLRDDET